MKFLRNKATNSQFALCTLSSDRAVHLRLIQGFTADENVLLSAVNSKRGAPQSGRWQQAEAGPGNAVNTVREFAQGGEMSGWQALLSGLEKMQVEQEATDTDTRVGITIDALTQVARYMSGIPGRKNLVWLSGSFPISISPDLNEERPVSASRNYTTQLRQATNLLAGGQVAVYPVDVRGLAAEDISTSDNMGVGPRQTLPPSTPGRPSSDDSVVPPSQLLQQGMLQRLALRSAERDTLNQIASDTGGKAFFNSNAIDEAINTAAEQSSNYYTLSYTPANRNYNGRFRKIKVGLAEKGYRLHYRPGYFADDPYAPAKPGDSYRNTGAAAMQHGSPQSRQILFAVRIVPIGAKIKADSARAGNILLASKAQPSLPSKVELQHYGIDYALDSSDLHFVPSNNDLQHCALNFMIAAFDEDGRQLSGMSKEWTSDLDRAALKDVISGGVRIHQEVDVPVKAVFLRLGVNDAISNHLGTVELPLPVQAAPDVPRVVKHSLPEIEPD
jgi:VWFA-related protein